MSLKNYIKSFLLKEGINPYGELSDEELSDISRGTDNIDLQYADVERKSKTKYEKELAQSTKFSSYEELNDYLISLDSQARGKSNYSIKLAVLQEEYKAQTGQDRYAIFDIEKKENPTKEGGTYSNRIDYRVSCSSFYEPITNNDFEVFETHSTSTNLGFTEVLEFIKEHQNF
jgi:hypothetical protein